MEKSHIYKLEISLLENTGKSEVDLTGVDKHYVDFFTAVLQFNYEEALADSAAVRLLQLSELSQDGGKPPLDVLVQDCVKRFLTVEHGDEVLLRQLVVLFVGVSCLQLFVQNNWVGPATERDPDTLFPHWFPESVQGNTLTEFALRCLRVDSEEVYPLASYPLYLYMAKVLLVDCSELIADCQSIGFWQMRTLKTQQALLEERSQILKAAILHIIKILPERMPFSETTLDVQMQFHIEAGHLCYFYYEATLAKEHFHSAHQKSGLTVELTGILGKRTRFQKDDIPQLVLHVEKAIDVNSDMNEIAPVKTERHLLPKDVRLDDESVLEKMKPKEPVDLSTVSLTGTQQAMILGLCHNLRKAHESDGQGGIVTEELMSYINCVLLEPCCWSVQTAALLMRSRWEKGSTRRVQRSLSQLEELVNQFRRKEIPPSVRLPLVYSLSLPPHWVIEQELGKLLDEIGAVSSALEVYLRLQAWEDVIACYAKLGHRDQAEKLIRKCLAEHETPSLWCYLGDVTTDPQYYHRAWEVSQGHSARAQRALAYYHFGKREMKESLVHFEKSLQVSPLQIGVWFTYGCAALESTEYSLAATAFHRCVTLDSDNFAAWSNLATAYIKAANKPRAFITYQEALKCDYENWRIWENYLAVAVDVGEFDEAIRAYHRLLDLRDKHTDVPVLSVLVKIVNENVTDASGAPSSRLRPKLLQLFGHITAKVTGSSDIWRLYGELLASSESPDNTSRERVCQYFRSAHSCATAASNWEKDATKCEEIAKLTHLLANAYLSCLQHTTDTSQLNRVRSSARLVLKGVIVKIKRQLTDQLTESSPADLANLVQQLEEDMLHFSELPIS